MHMYDRNYIYLGDHEIKNETPGKKMYPDKKKLIICQSKAYIYCIFMAKWQSCIFLPQNMILKWASHDFGQKFFSVFNIYSASVWHL